VGMPGGGGGGDAGGGPSSAVVVATAPVRFDPTTAGEDAVTDRFNFADASAAAAAATAADAFGKPTQCFSCDGEWRHLFQYPL
jgi:hypothetical protein